MNEHETTIDGIADAGTRFGARAQALLEMADKVGEADGRGVFTAREEGEVFEIILERVIDALSDKSVSRPAIDVFEAEAKLAFYGVITDSANITSWRNQSWNGRDDFLAAKRADEPAQIADYLAGMKADA